MDKKKVILYDCKLDELQAYIKQKLAAQGIEAVQTVKYSTEQLQKFTVNNHVDALIMRCGTLDELKRATAFRDSVDTLILLISGAMKGREEIKDALNAGLNNIVFTGLNGIDRSLKGEIVEILKEKRTQKDARVYYGFDPLPKPDFFRGSLTLEDEDQALLLLEYLLNPEDGSELDERFETALRMLPQEERPIMAKSLPGPVVKLLESNPDYIEQTNPAPKKKGLSALLGKKNKEKTELAVLPKRSDKFTESVNSMTDVFVRQNRLSAISMDNDNPSLRTAEDIDESFDIKTETPSEGNEFSIPKSASAEEIPTLAEEQLPENEDASVLADDRKEEQSEDMPETADESIGNTDTQPDEKSAINEQTEQEETDGQPEINADEQPLEPTCEKEGRKYEIDKDGSRKLIILPPLGHDEKIKETPATCKTEGKRRRYCKRCNKTFETIVLPVKEHTWSEWFDKVKVSCLAEGLRVRKCEVCGNIEREELPALPHEFSKVDLTPASCTEQGESCEICSICGTIKDNSRIKIEPLGHDWMDWVVKKEADCENDGLRTRRCARCNAEEVENIPGGHLYGNTQTKQATCENGGYSYHICIRCGYREELTKTEPLGHDFKETVIKPATCTKTGISKKVCTRCGYQIEASEMPMIPHELIDKVTIELSTCNKEGAEEGICKLCGRTVTQKLPLAPHKGKWAVKIRPTCCTQGTKGMKCDVCGTEVTEEIPSISHVGEWEVTTPATCTAEGEKERICEYCGAKETKAIPKIEHCYDSIRVESPTCTEEGKIYQICRYCNETKVAGTLPCLGHIPKKITTKPESCNDEGSYEVICDRCKTVIESGAIPATGHDWDEWKITASPTCTAEGEKQRICKKCGHFQTQPMPCVPHAWDREMVTENSCTESGRIIRKCLTCGCTEVVGTAEPLGHKFTDWKTTGFYKKRKCERCGVVEKKISAFTCMLTVFIALIIAGAIATAAILLNRERNNTLQSATEASTPSDVFTNPLSLKEIEEQTSSDAAQINYSEPAEEQTTEATTAVTETEPEPETEEKTRAASDGKLTDPATYRIDRSAFTEYNEQLHELYERIMEGNKDTNQTE